MFNRLSRIIRFGILSIGGIGVLVLAYQLITNGAYICGRCGTSWTVAHFLWLDLSDPPYDEYGIEERWLRAHRQNCEHIWIRREGDAVTNAYWSPLSFAIASGVDLAKLSPELLTMDAQALRKRDAMGRTIMHWLVVHPNVQKREELITALVAKGASLEDKDNDGLSPIDWAHNAELSRSGVDN